MTLHTIYADHLDAARGGVLVVDGKPAWGAPHPDGLDGSLTARPLIHVAPVEFVKLTEPCKACDGSGHATFGNQVRTSEKCPACDGSGRPWLRVDVLEYGGMSDDGPGPWKAGSFRAHVLDVVPIVASDDYRVGFDRVKVYPSGEASLFRAKPSDDDLRDIPLPPGDHVGRYAVLIEPEAS